MEINLKSKDHTPFRTLVFKALNKFIAMNGNSPQLNATVMSSRLAVLNRRGGTDHNGNGLHYPTLLTVPPQQTTVREGVISLFEGGAILLSQSHGSEGLLLWLVPPTSPNFDRLLHWPQPLTLRVVHLFLKAGEDDNAPAEAGDDAMEVVVGEDSPLLHSRLESVTRCFQCKHSTTLDSLIQSICKSIKTTMFPQAPSVAFVLHALSPTADGYDARSLQGYGLGTSMRQLIQNGMLYDHATLLLQCEPPTAAGTERTNLAAMYINQLSNGLFPLSVSLPPGDMGGNPTVLRLVVSPSWSVSTFKKEVLARAGQLRSLSQVIKEQLGAEQHELYFVEAFTPLGPAGVRDHSPYLDFQAGDELTARVAYQQEIYILVRRSYYGASY
jgi:hypothetical protein